MRPVFSIFSLLAFSFVILTLFYSESFMPQKGTKSSNKVLLSFELFSAFLWLKKFVIVEQEPFHRASV